MSQPHQLNLVSYLAPNMFGFYQAVAAYLSRKFNLETQLIQSQYDPLKDPMLLEDQLDLAFICGLPFAQHQRLANHQLQAIVAPVMQASRYQNRAVYYSDLIVKADSDLHSFDDLKGKTLCYNDPGSNSGYNLVRGRLLELGVSNFFAKVIPSGSHQGSIRWVIEGLADASAIDSTVLEQELRDFPQFCQQLRVIEVIGPCPMPPVVVATRLGSDFVAALQSALCQPDQELQEAMARSHIQHYLAVQSEDYEPIAKMYDQAVAAGYLVIS